MTKNRSVKDDNTVTIELKKEPIVVGEIKVNRMNLEQIKAAGIDITAPQNQFIYKYTINLGFTPDGSPTTLIASGDGSIVSISDDNPQSQKPVIVPVAGHPEIPPSIFYMQIPTEASMLKEFFEVKLNVLNTADSEFVIKDAIVQLNLPKGLSIVEGGNGSG